MDKKILSYFSGDIKSALEKTNENINEIRIRINRHLSVVCSGKSYFLSKDGTLSASSFNCPLSDVNAVNQIFEAVCRYSVHSFQKDICNGFITVQGGHRVGICGTAVIQNRNIVNIKDISGLNFRIASQIIGCSDNICNIAFASGLKSIIIAGAPLSGKTTVLRDICRRLGKKHRVSLIDERGEIAAVWNGLPQNDIGEYTDVFNGYSKRDGIESAVRVMSPDIIICDEAGNEEDYFSFRYALTCGINLAVSVHGTSMKDIMQKVPFFSYFDYIFFLPPLTANGAALQVIKVREYNEKRGSYSDNNDIGFGRSVFFGKSEKTYDFA